MFKKLRLNVGIKAAITELGINVDIIPQSLIDMNVELAIKTKMTSQEAAYLMVRGMREYEVFPAEHWKNHIDPIARKWVRASKLDMIKVNQVQRSLDEASRIVNNG